MKEKEEKNTFYDKSFQSINTTYTEMEKNSRKPNSIKKLLL